MIGVGAMHDARPAGRAACELDRRFDAFRAGIREKDLVQIGYEFQQAFGQHARERRNIELHKVGQVAIENALQRLAQGRMIPANRKNAKTTQQVKIARAIAIEQVLALPLLKADIVTNCLKDSYKLLI